MQFTGFFFNDQKTEAEWCWTKDPQDITTFNRWVLGQPYTDLQKIRNYVSSDDDGRWSDRECDKAYYVIREKPFEDLESTDLPVGDHFRFGRYRTGETELVSQSAIVGTGPMFWCAGGLACNEAQYFQVGVGRSCSPE